VAAVCGDNAALLSRLRRLAEGSGGRLLPLGDVEDVARLLAASDLLVAKPGPASLAEAFQLGVPVVLAAAAATPQERFNVRVVAERGLGIVVRRWEAIPGAVAALARDRERLRRLRTAVAAFPPNRAVFEALEAYARLAGRPARAEAGVA
jgi:UDP-N-acetylglucosamine:LPS N-acetylglucosamine transferase